MKRLGQFDEKNDDQYKQNQRFENHYPDIVEQLHTMAFPYKNQPNYIPQKISEISKF
jgi:hypothetical protein